MRVDTCTPWRRSCVRKIAVKSNRVCPSNRIRGSVSTRSSLPLSMRTFVIVHRSLVHEKFHIVSWVRVVEIKYGVRFRFHPDRALYDYMMYIACVHIPSDHRGGAPQWQCWVASLPGPFLAVPNAATRPWGSVYQLQWEEMTTGYMTDATVVLRMCSYSSDLLTYIKQIGL